MNEAEKIILIILSSFLVLFLGLGIALFITLMRFSRKMHGVADKANSIAGNFQNAASAFEKSAGPLALGKFFVNIARSAANHKKGK